MNDTTTCGESFRALATTLLNSPELDAAPDVPFGTYAMGFMAGQAEKVASGACYAFMVRPATDWWAWTLVAMDHICAHYGLTVEMDEQQGEIWGCADACVKKQLAILRATVPINSPVWHSERGRLCGIASSNIDIYYHRRPGHRTRCEPDDSPHL